MNKKAIWLSVGIMGIALLGILVLQFYWISWSVRLNEKQFDDSAIAALKRVSDMLQKEKENWEIDQLDQILFEGSAERNFLFNMVDLTDEMKKNNLLFTQDSILLNEIKHPLDSWDMKRKLAEMYDRQIRIHPVSLDQRINPSKLSDLLKHEFQELHVDLNYNFGVYDNSMKSFVILNGNYLVNLGDGKASKSEMELEKSSKETTYIIDLFKTARNSPGYLKVVFPNKTNWLWRSVLPLIILTLLLAGLILACFYYVTSVVFKQKKLSEIKNDFVNNMTHEFKTPIATISLASDSILSNKIIHEPEKIQRFIGIIKEENKRMLSQVEKVLQMALLDKHDFELNLKSVDVHEIIQNAVNNIGMQVSQRNGTLLIELNATKSIIMADNTHLTNIIYNLLDNANKYSPESPWIKISTKNRLNGIEIIVQDKGIGMTKENQKMVFEKFYRVPTGNLHNVKGFGLGLSYVKEMVIAHKGQITIDSELNKGSTFTLFLPN
ncbi:MAG: HAMP domain-containing sensor histidine kinase [Saprospiraceae bacterium]